MSPATLSLHHLIRQPKLEAESPPLLILLHGLGSNEQDLFGLAPYLDERFLVISARAPLTLMPGSYAWFHATFDSGPTRINAAEAESSRRVVLGFIEEVVDAYHAAKAHVYLAGFSQGAIMSLSVMLTEPQALAGVVAMSGRILPEVKPLAVAPHRLEKFPVFVSHGIYDQVLPILHGRATRDYLATLPVDLVYREYPMAHEISQASLSDVSAWLSERLEADRLEPTPHRPTDRAR